MLDSVDLIIKLRHPPSYYEAVDILELMRKAADRIEQLERQVFETQVAETYESVWYEED